MLENEEKNSSDRLASLEKHVQHQNDELLCLKSALADVIRRMQHLETTTSNGSMPSQQFNHSNNYGRQQHRSPHKQNNVQSKPSIQTATSTKTTNTNKQQQLLKEALQNHNNTNTHNNSVYVSSNNNEQNKENNNRNTTMYNTSRSLVGSKANSVEKLPQVPPKSKILFQASVDFNQQTLCFNSDSGMVKFFLRGRPINVFLPKANQVSLNSNEIGFRFDTESIIKAPKEQLKLEWVYGYRGIEL